MNSYIYTYWFTLLTGKKGSQSSVPGLSCKNILDSGDLDTSRTYWIRPQGLDASFLGYCEITAIGSEFKTLLYTEQMVYVDFPR